MEHGAFEEMNAREKLKVIDKAIEAVMLGGQSYTIGSRSLTRADLRQLREMKNELEASIASESSDTLLGGVSLAKFERW